MEEIISKMHQRNESKLPRKHFVDKNYIILETEIAKKLNEFLTEIVPFLASEISTLSKPIERLLKKPSTTLPERYLNTNDLKDPFFSLKMNKSTGADEIPFNVLEYCFGELIDILRYVF